MNAKRIYLIALPLVLIGLAIIVLLSYKSVNLVVDGESHSQRTFAFTVGQLIQNEKLTLAPGDEINPTLETWLHDGDKVRLDRAAQVTIQVDGEILRLLTVERLPGRLLAQAGVSLESEDQVLSDGTVIDPQKPLRPAPYHQLQVIRACPVTIKEGGKERSFRTTAATLGQALWEAGVKLHAADRLSLPPETHLVSTGQKVEIVRSREMVITVGEEELHVRTSAQTVGEALADAGLSLQGSDYSDPPEDTLLPASGHVRLVRVREAVTIESAPLPFETEYQPAEDLELDTQSVIQTGEYGLTARRLRIVYEDGQEISRRVEDEWIARQPRNRIIGYGTKIVMHTLDTPDGTIQYWRALKMWATSYHPATTGKVTASGLPLKKGVAAIDRRYIPFYTRMYVPGYGEALAADVGGGVIGRWIDLGYSDDDYVSWHQWVTVYFLWPPPENVVWIIP